jgi:hypothetical protein
MDPDAIDPVVRKYASNLGLDRHPNSEIAVTIILRDPLPAGCSGRL